MANKIETEPCGGGCRIIRLVTTDRDVHVPEEHSGMPVVSLGPRFMGGSPHAPGRRISVPATVTDIDPEAFSGIIGLTAILYRGDFETFNSAGISVDCDCRLETGDGHCFDFMSGFPMHFPAFDEAMGSMSFRMSPEIALMRLKDPVHLSDEHRTAYAAYLSRSLMPRAEQAVSRNDIAALDELVSAGVLSDRDVRRLLERSLSSGKTAVTSMLMSVLNRRNREEKGI